MSNSPKRVIISVWVPEWLWLSNKTGKETQCLLRSYTFLNQLSFSSIHTPKAPMNQWWLLLLFSQSCPTLWPHELQHARLPCPSLSPRICSNSCSLTWWFHPTISSSVTSFSFCPQSFPARWLFCPSYWEKEKPQMPSIFPTHLSSENVVRSVWRTTTSMLSPSSTLLPLISLLYLHQYHYCQSIINSK